MHIYNETTNLFCYEIKEDEMMLLLKKNIICSINFKYNETILHLFLLCTLNRNRHNFSFFFAFFRGVCLFACSLACHTLLFQINLLKKKKKQKKQNFYYSFALVFTQTRSKPRTKQKKTKSEIKYTLQISI